MPSPTQRRGSAAESRAAQWLQQQGYVILAQHYTCRYGEIDIVAKKENALVFVEVRSRKPSQFGDVLQSMSQLKQQRLAGAIACYLSEHEELEHMSYRCDLVSVDPGTGKIAHYPALELADA